MAFIVLRLHPEDGPVAASDFLEDIANNDFTIRAYRVAFDGLAEHLLGEATWEGIPNDSDIIQHVGPISVIDPTDEPKSVATAIIVFSEPPPGGADEYDGLDIVVRLYRAGDFAHPIRTFPLSYNVVVHSGNPVVDHADWPDEYGASDVAAYIPVPNSGVVFNPGDAVVELPPDGSPPNFEDLRGASLTVLAADDGVTFANTDEENDALAALTPAEARHIAFEITWNRHVEPLARPQPGFDNQIEEMYTADTNDNRDRARSLFEAERLRYQATHDARAEVLSKYVYSLAAAVAAQRFSESALSAGLGLPVRLVPDDTPGKIKEVKVSLVN